MIVGQFGEMALCLRKPIRVGWGVGSALLIKRLLDIAEEFNFPLLSTPYPVRTLLFDAIEFSVSL